ncbi:MAG TPA: GNAT family N-acetyltransferase [Candidatus Limnocylindrales bacterium]|jgi:ribosomal protein S18 acetylase RimI-like enzyme
MTGPRAGEPAGIAFRHPGEADHLAVVARAEAWWPAPGVRALFPRLWFRHFAGTCWLAEQDGRPIGFVVGLIGADRPAEARLLLVGVDPNHRRAGIGRALVERFAATVSERGADSLEAVVWAGDRPPIEFLRALGFRPDTGPGTSLIYGVPAHADYDAEGDDKVVLRLRLR